MAEEASFPAGHRLSDDLRRIREARELSIDDVHNETRIARTLIESFEEGQLYDHPTYNRVYLRSFIKAYADALQLPRDQALNALDAALEGTYQHALAEEYLAGEASESDSTPDPSSESDSSSSTSRTSTPDGPTAGGPEGRGGIVGPPRAVGEETEDAQIPMDAPPDDAATESSSSSSTVEESDAPSEESPSEKHSDDAAARADAEGEEEVPPMDEDDSPTEETGEKETAEEASSDEASIDEDTSDTDAGAGQPETPDLTGPEALRSSPDEDEEAESEGQGEPAWMAEDPSDQPSADASEPEPPDTPGPASMDEGVETGVVGEATEMGSGGAAPSSQPTSPPGRTDASRSSGSGLTAFLQDANRRIIVTGVGIGVVLLVLAGLGIAYFSSGNGDPSTPTTETPAPTDTATAKRTSPASPDTSTTTAAGTTSTAASPNQPPPPANVTLGDRIHLLVQAVDNVSGLRLQRDEDLRRPYWIEEGDASVFPFKRRAIIGSELQDVRLYVEGYRYPFSPADTVGGLELTRESLQAFVDTLRGSPDSLAVTPDTIPVGPLEGAAPAPKDTTLEESPSE